MSVMRSSEPVEEPLPEEVSAQEALRPPDDFVEDAPDHRRRTTRQVRHVSRTQLHLLAGDEEAIEDADLMCPKVPHDLGRKTSRRPKHDPKPGRRGGFKVWKTPFWKRRNSLRAERNAATRRLADEE